MEHGAALAAYADEARLLGLAQTLRIGRLQLVQVQADQRPRAAAQCRTAGRRWPGHAAGGRARGARAAAHHAAVTPQPMVCAPRQRGRPPAAIVCPDSGAILGKHRVPLLIEGEPARRLPALPTQRHIEIAYRGVRQAKRRRPVRAVGTHADRGRHIQQFRVQPGLLDQFACCGGAGCLSRSTLPPGGTQPRTRCLTSRTCPKSGSVTQTWKRPKTRRRNLRTLGIPDHKAREWASSGKGYWRIAGSPILARALPNIHWADLGLKGLYPTWHRLKTTT